MLELRLEGVEGDLRVTFPWQTVKAAHVQELGRALRRLPRPTPMGHRSITVVIPPGTRAVGRNAFASGPLPIIMRAVELPSSLRVLGAKSFFGAVSVLEVTVPLHCLVGEAAFQRCTALRRVIFGPLEELSAGAFRDCTALEDVQITGNVIFIRCDAFRGCTSLRSLALPDTVRHIGSCALEGTGLTSFVMPPRVTAVSHGLCRNCRNLRRVDLKNAEHIYAEAFKNCGLASLVVPETVHVIEEEAFSKAGLAGGLSFAPSVVPLRTIEQGAFAGTKMQHVSLPQRLKNAPEKEAFYHCDNLETVTYHPESPVDTVAVSTFAQCDKVHTVRLPRLLRQIERRAFGACRSLADINLGDTALERAGVEAFDCCHALRNVTLPATLQVMQTLCFARSGVHRVSTKSPGGNLVVEPLAFYNCKHLWSVVLNFELDRIGVPPNLVTAPFLACSRLATVLARNENLHLLVEPNVHHAETLQRLAPDTLRAELRLHNRWWQHMDRVPPEWRLNLKGVVLVLWRRGLPRVVVTMIVQSLPLCDFASLQ